jgi:PBSX family phage terminase large subunit
MTNTTLESRLRKLESRRDQLQLENNIVLPGWLESHLNHCGFAVPCSGRASHYEALPAQQTFHSDLTSRFKGYSGPIGSGKSYALVYEALFLSRLNPGLLGLVGAPTYRMLQDSTQRTFFEVLDKEAIAYDFYKQENRILLRTTKSEIIFRTLDNPERLRGPNLAWFALDELTYAREDAWTRLLGRLRHPQAGRLCGCAVWTPKGYDWVHGLFLEKMRPDYKLVQATPSENLHLPADFYESLKDAYAERFYRQEVLGEYLDMFGGNVYYAFSDANITETRYDPKLPLCWALDFNVDPMCSVICQIEDTTKDYQIRAHGRKTVRVLDEIVLPNSNTVSAAEEFIRRVTEYQGFPYQVRLTIYGDASGNSQTTKASRTDYELIREVFRRHSEFVTDIKPNRANPRVQDRVNAVNSALHSTSKRRNVFVDPKCKELIKDFRQVKWRRDSNGNSLPDLDKSTRDRTHASDAFGYLAAKEFGMYPPAGERSGMIV